MEIVRVDEGDFEDLARLLYWRKTGTYTENFDWSSFLNDELSDMISSGIIWIYAAKFYYRFVGYVLLPKSSSLITESVPFI
jgi:hypothetical protein